MNREWLQAAKEILGDLTYCEVSPGELVTLEVTLDALTAALEQAFFEDEETVDGLDELLERLQEREEFGDFIADDLPSQVRELLEECSKANYWESHGSMPQKLKDRLTKCHEDLLSAIGKCLKAKMRNL